MAHDFYERVCDHRVPLRLPAASHPSRNAAYIATGSTLIYLTAPPSETVLAQVEVG